MAAALAGVALAASLGGCVSTQRKNARAELVADRTLAARAPLKVRQLDPTVRVVHVTLVRGAGAGAFVVTLRNSGARPATDVPVAVGVRDAGGRRVAANGGGELDWFRTHVPAIPARATATWVFAAHRALPAGVPYAIAGAPGGAVVSHASGPLPALAARVVPDPGVGEGRRRADAGAARGAHGGRSHGRAGTAGGGAAGRRAAGGAHGGRSHGRADTAGGGVAGRRPANASGAVTVALVNRSAIPQYDVQVYAVVRDGTRVLAAGAAAIAHLGTHESARVRVALVGAAGRHTVRVFALPTIFE